MRSGRVAGLVYALFVASTARAQESPIELIEARAKADSLLRARQFSDAAPIFRRLLARDSSDGNVWSGYASSLDGQAQFAQAIPAWTRVLRLGTGRNVAFGNAIPAFRLARDYAMLGRDSIAFQWLDSALAWRLTLRANLESDSAFKRMRATERFARAVGLPLSRQLSRDEQWRYDLDFFVSEAKRLHVGPDRPAHSAAFQQLAREINARIPALSDGQIALEMRRLATMLGDGHTAVATNPPRLPVDLYNFSDGLFVVRGSGVAEPLVGARVERIGTLTVEEATRRVAAYIPRDNDMGIVANAPAMLTRPLVLQAIGAITDTASVPFVVRLKDGATKMVALTGASMRAPGGPSLPPPSGGSAPVPLYLQNQSAYWLRALPNEKAVYVQFNAVQNMPDKPLAAFAEELKRTASGAKALVVDIRFNGGGNTFLYPPLVNAIVHFAESNPENRVVVIIGRRTFSAAQNFASTLDRYLNVTFVGEPTGSRPNFVGESPQVQLPYSRIATPISTRVHQNADFTDTRMWIAPQVPTPLSSKDYFANRDPALEAALALVRRPAT